MQLRQQKVWLRLHLINRVLTVPSGTGGATVPKAISDARRQAVLAKHEDIYRAIDQADPDCACELIDFLRFLANRSESNPRPFSEGTPRLHMKLDGEIGSIECGKWADFFRNGD